MNIVLFYTNIFPCIFGELGKQLFLQHTFIYEENSHLF